jgi:hypothetical protein
LVCFEYTDKDGVSHSDDTELLIDIVPRKAMLSSAAIFVNGVQNANLSGIKGIVGSAILAIYDSNYEQITIDDIGLDNKFV